MRKEVNYNRKTMCARGLQMDVWGTREGTNEEAGCGGPREKRRRGSPRAPGKDVVPVRDLTVVGRRKTANAGGQCGGILGMYQFLHFFKITFVVPLFILSKTVPRRHRKSVQRDVNCCVSRENGRNEKCGLGLHLNDYESPIGMAMTVVQCLLISNRMFVMAFPYSPR